VFGGGGGGREREDGEGGGEGGGGARGAGGGARVALRACARVPACTRRLTCPLLPDANKQTNAPWVARPAAGSLWRDLACLRTGCRAASSVLPPAACSPGPRAWADGDFDFDADRGFGLDGVGRSTS
jgi:hypothetical protein